MGYSDTYGFIIEQREMSRDMYNEILEIAQKHLTIERDRIKSLDDDGYPEIKDLKIVGRAFGKIEFALPKAIEGTIIVDPMGDISLAKKNGYKIGAIDISYRSFFFHRNDGECIPLIMEKTLPVYKELYYLLDPIVGCWWGDEIQSSMAERVESCYKFKNASLAADILDKINVFPPWIVDSLGKERFRSLPHFVVEELDDGGFLVHYPFDDFWNINFYDGGEHLNQAKKHLRNYQ